jgi:hypothetical protein
MNALALALAAALLTTPPGVPDAAPDPAEFAEVQAAVQQLAVEWEILDPREVRYVLARPEEWAGDLDLLRRRYHDLRDAPKLADAQRFPDRGAVNELLAFNRAYRRHVGSARAMNLDRVQVVDATLRETDELYQVWDAARDSRCEFYYVTVRRAALARLREALGPDAYAAGDLPPHVPLWRFRDG